MSSPTLPSLGLSTLVLVLCLDRVQHKVINTFAGPYIAFGNIIDPCPANGVALHLWRLSHFNPIRPFDLQKMTTNITIGVDVMDKYFARIDMAVWANNQWKENAFIFNFPNQGCMALRDQIPSVFRLFAKHHSNGSRMTTDKKKPCVVPGGTVAMENEPVQWVFPNFPVMPYGRYKIRVRSFPTKTEIMPIVCLTIDCEIIPRPT